MEKLLAALLAGITDGAAIGLVALGFVIVYKATRILNFGQAEIGTLAIYVEANLVGLGLPVIVAIILALGFAAVLGAATERLFRPLAQAPRLTVTVATLGITTILVAFQILRFKIDPRVAPELISGNLFTLANFDVRFGRILALVVTVALGAALYTFFKRSLFGLGVLAVAQDQTALRLQGLPLNRVSAFVWAAGAVVCALAGMIIAPTIGSFAPGFMTTTLVASALAAALVGGLTSLPGAFVGGMAIGITQNIAKFYLESLAGAEFLAVFIAMVVVLLVKPNGLMGAEA
jgi:branched-chain amino acid transport system permease protein